MSLHKLNNNVLWINRNHNHQAPHLADFLKIQTTLFAKKKKSLSTLLLSLGNAGAFSVTKFPSEIHKPLLRIQGLEDSGQQRKEYVGTILLKLNDNLPIQCCIADIKHREKNVWNYLQILLSGLWARCHRTDTKRILSTVLKQSAFKLFLPCCCHAHSSFTARHFALFLQDQQIFMHCYMCISTLYTVCMCLHELANTSKESRLGWVEKRCVGDFFLFVLDRVEKWRIKIIWESLILCDFYSYTYLKIILLTFSPFTFINFAEGKVQK